jgi:hypothetical protein
MSSTIDLTQDVEVHLPPTVLTNWLPNKNKPVFHLFSFKHYPANKVDYIIPSDFSVVLHREMLVNFSYSILPQLPPPVNPKTIGDYQAAVKAAKHPIHSITIIPPPRLRNVVDAPIWIIDYWREMNIAVSYREQWKAALMWLQSYSGMSATAAHCQDLLIALSYFPWSGNNISVKDITSLLSDCGPKSYLSDLHIDFISERILASHQQLSGPEISNRHIIIPVNVLGAITLFYGSKNPPTKTRNTFWESLMVIENRIIQGEIDSVGGVYHLPLHWVSVIFNIQEWSIHYGDSLGEPLPKSERLAFTKWIQHLKYRSKQNVDSNPVQIHFLSTGYQDDTVSCGLFALNALDHYYLKYPLLSPDRVSVALARMDIALYLLQANMVCILLHIHYAQTHQTL